VNEPKTHFEQVSLEIVKEIVRKQAKADLGGFAAIEMDVPALAVKPKILKGKL
jgi:hypothetical protein